MKTIEISDVIYASVLKGNLAVEEIKLTGFGNFGSLLSKIIEILRERVSGLVTLQLRNITTGQNLVRQINLPPMATVA